jgi:murein DD-endopeptidase MepM/ murein hydrolase activator NlpD
MKKTLGLLAAAWIATAGCTAYKKLFGDKTKEPAQGPVLPERRLQLSIQPSALIYDDHPGHRCLGFVVVAEHSTSQRAVIQSARAEVREKETSVHTLDVDLKEISQEMGWPTISVLTKEKVLIPGFRIRIPEGTLVTEVRVKLEVLWPDGRVTPQSVQTPVQGYAPKTLWSLPFDSEWMVLQGHEPEEAHRTAGSEAFATDWIAVRKGATMNPGARSPYQPADFIAYGLPLRAPAAGRIVRAVDGRPDEHPTLFSPPWSEAPKDQPDRIAGNYIVIDHENGEFTLMGHLKPKSLKVTLGEVVKSGDVIAECGNSGNSAQPHLHIQLMDQPDLLAARGLPPRFKGYAVLVDGKWLSVPSGCPQKGELAKP